MINFYDLLGVSSNATSDEIKTSYRNMVKKYHPDVNGSQEAQKVIRSLNEAKTTLLDEEKRKEYDEILQGINNSKQFSKEKSETYTGKTEEYKENYEEVYITRWQYYINYIKNGLDKVWIKLLKTFLVIINLLIFSLFKAIIIFIVFLLYVTDEIIDYFVVFLFIMSFVYLFILKDIPYPDYISFIPAHVENFILLFTIATTIEVLKVLMFTKSTNLYAFFQNIHDKIFIYILMK